MEMIGIKSYLDKSLVVVDTCIQDAALVAEGIKDAEMLILKPDQDGVEQITNAIHRLGNVSNLHILASSLPGCLFLGNTELSLWNLETYDLYLLSWFVPFAFPHPLAPSLSLYSSHVGDGAIGAEFTRRLRNLTNASITTFTTPFGCDPEVNDWKRTVDNPMPHPVLVDLSLRHLARMQAS